MAEVVKNNLVSTLQFEVEKLDYNSIKADKDNEDVKSGGSTFVDLNRMTFVINGKPVGQNLTNMLNVGATDLSFDYKKVVGKSEEEVIFYNIGLNNKHLLPPSTEKDPNYRPFLVEAFKGMFKYAGAEVPNDAIIQELITSCNQAGYEGFLHTNVLKDSSLFPYAPKTKKVYIDCNNSNCAKLKVNMEEMPIILMSDFTEHTDEIIARLTSNFESFLSFSSSLEFKLQSQKNEEVEYTDGKLSLTLPKELAEDKGLLSKIMEAIKNLFKKVFGIEIENINLIEHDFDKPNGKMDVENVDKIQDDNSKELIA